MFVSSCLYGWGILSSFFLFLVICPHSVFFFQCRFPRSGFRTRYCLVVAWGAFFLLFLSIFLFWHVLLLACSSGADVFSSRVACLGMSFRSGSVSFSGRLRSVIPVGSFALLLIALRSCIISSRYMMQRSALIA